MQAIDVGGRSLSCRGVARHHVHMASHSTLSPLGPNRPCGHIECSALSQRAAMRADGRRRSAGWYCSRPSSSLPHGRKKRGHCSGYGDGRKRVTRCAADLQALTVLTQNSCSAARVRPAVAMNRLSHCEHRLERTASSSRLEELQDRGGALGGAHPVAAGTRCRACSWTPSSFAFGVGRAHSPLHRLCAARNSAAVRWTAGAQALHRCRRATCQLIWGRRLFHVRRDPVSTASTLVSTCQHLR